jgi:hypothetical protein
LAFNGTLLLLGNNKPVSEFTEQAEDWGPIYASPKDVNATAMSITGAGIWANHTRIVLRATTTISANNQSALYLNSGSARFNAVRLLDNTATDAVLVFVNASSTFAGTFDCAQSGNPLDIDPKSNAGSSTCVLAQDSSLEFNGPASFTNNLQRR